LLLAALTLPLVVEIVALAVIPSVEIPRTVTRPLIIVFLVLGILEGLRVLEASVRHLKRTKDQSEDDEGGGILGQADRFWESIGETFISLGTAGIAIYALTSVLCVTGFIISLSIQTAEDAAASVAFSQSESTLLAMVSMAVLMAQLRLMFVRRFGWPFD
jgi:hypothetical protein